MNWADVWKRDLQEKYPDLHRKYRRDGSLERRANELAERARLAKESVMSQLLQRNPLPLDYVAKVRTLDSLNQQAEEIVLHEVVLLPPSSGTAPDGDQPAS